MASEKTPTAAEEEKPRKGSVKTLGRYRLEKKVGEGGMGAVYRAVDDELGRVVALKILPRDKAQNEMLVKRFKAEARAAANLKHKNIVGIYDSGEADGYLYIAMEFVDGIDVQDLLKRKGVLSPKRSLDIIRQVTLALEHAYEQNIVHRDIKPSNLMIMRDGSIKLADMGLARSMSDSDSAGITRAGTTVGTVDYMSPEQARDSKSADSRSDIYSLGASWYYMLTGEPPFPEGDLLNRITAHGTEPRPNPQAINEEVPDAISQIIETMMAIEPGGRFQTPSALLEELNTANLKAKAITTDLLSALADGDTDVPGSRPVKQQRPKRPASSDRSQSGKPKRSSSASGQTKKVRKSNSPKSENATATDTSAEDGSTSSIPSARDAMLGGKRLRRSYRQQGGAKVEFSYGRIGAIIIGIVALVIVGNMALSAFQNRNEEPAPAPAPSRSEGDGGSSSSPANPPVRTLPRKLPSS
jgi:eukaryotic-like serine/threonine-protein kinase